MSSCRQLDDMVTITCGAGCVVYVVQVVQDAFDLLLCTLNLDNHAQFGANACCCKGAGQPWCVWDRSARLVQLGGVRVYCLYTVSYWAENFRSDLDLTGSDHERVRA